MKKFEKPKYQILALDESANYGKFVVEPLERGFGITLGNALRRVLLSSLPGAAVFALEIDKARHEFSALSGVVEDVTGIVLNIKELVFSIDDEADVIKKLKIDVTGPKEVTGADIETPAGVEIISKDAKICTLADGAHFKATLYAKNGRGFVTAEKNKANNKDVNFSIGMIPTDSKFAPINKVAYFVDPIIGRDQNYDKLTLEVWSNGEIKPQIAIAMASKILVDHLNLFVEMSEKAQVLDTMVEATEQPTSKAQSMTIEDLELSVRSYNCLKRAGIQTVEELTQKTEEDMIKVRNLGKKSLKEVKEVLSSYGLGFKSYE
jgi:DNA-directed RNA polymerase subunit alpha